MLSLRTRAIWFGLYLLVNLAIILFSISLWFRGMPSEAIFVGLWAPTLDLLYLMFWITFSPERALASAERRQPRALGRSRVA